MAVKMGNMSQDFDVFLCAAHARNPFSIHSDDPSLCVVFACTSKIEGKGEISSMTGELESVIRLRTALRGSCLYTE